MVLVSQQWPLSWPWLTRWRVSRLEFWMLICVVLPFPGCLVFKTVRFIRVKQVHSWKIIHLWFIKFFIQGWCPVYTDQSQTIGVMSIGFLLNNQVSAASDWLKQKKLISDWLTQYNASLWLVDTKQYSSLIGSLHPGWCSGLERTQEECYDKTVSDRRGVEWQVRNLSQIILDPLTHIYK